jgi:biotin carboxylase
VLLVAPGASYRTAAYARAASKLGIDLLIASQGTHPLSARSAQGLNIPLDDPRVALLRIAAEAKRSAFSGVVATDDRTVELASFFARALGLSHNPPSAARFARRKDLARAALASAGLPVPAYRRLDLRVNLARQLAGMQYPCVVKPLALSGSCGVIRANNATELQLACERIQAIVSNLPEAEESRFALVEQFVPGPEVALEGMLEHGALHVVALFDKPDPLDGPFFAESYYITPSRHEPAIQERIARRVGEACAAYGLCEGPVHAELRLGGGDVWVLEVAARTIGGDCARLLELGTGCSLEETVLRCALRQPLRLPSTTGALGVMMIPTPRAGVLRRVEGVLAAQRVPYVKDVTIAIGQGYELVPLPEGSSYLGFIFAQGPTPQLVECALRAAYKRLNFVVAPLWRLAPGTAVAALPQS